MLEGITTAQDSRWIFPFIITFLLLLCSSVYVFLVYFSPSLPIPSPSESTYRTTSSSTPLPLTSVHGQATVELSVVIPAYNEKERLGIMLHEAVDYLETRSLVAASSDAETTREKRRRKDGLERGSYEILIVDDGSSDGTSEIALQLAAELETKWTTNSSQTTIEKNQETRKLRGVIKVVTLVRNRGKGGSVKHGILHAGGDRILFVDADGASHFPDLALLQAELDRVETTPRSADGQGGHGLVVGSRAHLVRTEAVVKRSFVRNLLMRFFHTYLYILGIRAIRDTQCGFKLHTRQTAAHLYPLLHSPAWIFDCELLLLASLARIPTREVGIKWQEVGGSKVDLIKDSIAMAIDLLVIRGNYFIGRWRMPKKVDL